MMIRLVLFSEINSKFGFPFLQRLTAHPLVNVVGLVTSPTGKVCPYYVDEVEQVDLEQEARRQGIPVFRPAKVNDAALIDTLQSLQADYFLIANYQQIFKSSLLAVPQIATINFHPSPLPRYAGWGPFFWMAKYAERLGGVTAIIVNTQIDGGPILAQRSIQLSGTETALEIRQRHFEESFKLLDATIPRLVRGELRATPQNLAHRTYFGKPGEQDYQIDWNLDAETVLRTIRAGYRSPGAYALTESGEKFVILSAERADKRIPAQPGTTLCESSQVFVAVKDGWLHITTISSEGQEQPLHYLPGQVAFQVLSHAR
ncbi:MAG TPA: formyltransferase family protein [Ktedonobacteraceae bacterium]|nr:formyltransferase family protein [Ktedonobacteraceae bacterium]